MSRAYAASNASRRSRTSRAGSAGRGSAAAARYDALFAKMQAAESRLQSITHDNEQLKRDNTRLRKLQRERVNLNVLDDEAGASDAKVIALQNLHSQKIRALMKSIDKYKKEVKQLSAQNRESSRSRQIQGLQSQLRGAELVCDLLKEEMCNKLDLSPLEVNQWVFNKSIGGPKRFRPKTREALIIELEQMKKQHDRAVVAAKTAKQALREEQSKVRDMSSNRNASRASLASEGKAPSPSSATSYGRKHSEGKLQIDEVDYSHRVVELQGQIDALRQQCEIKDRQIRTYVSKVESLHETKRGLVGYKDKYERSRGKHTQLTSEVERMHQEAIDLRRQLERAKEKNLRLEAEVDVQKEEGLAANQDVGRKRLRDLQKISDLAEELDQVRSELEKAKRDAAEAHQQRLTGTQKAEVASVQLDKRLKELEAERSELKAELKIAQTKVEEISRDASATLKASNSETERKLESQRRKIKKLAEDLKNSEKDCVRFDQRTQNLEKQIEQQKKENTDHVKRLESQLQTKDEKLSQMVAKYAEMELKQSKAEKRVKSLSQEGSEGLAEAQKIYEKERDARKQLQVACKKLQQQVSAAKLKYRRLEADYNALRAARASTAGSKTGGPGPKTPARTTIADGESSGLSESEDDDPISDNEDDLMMR